MGPNSLDLLDCGDFIFMVDQAPLFCPWNRESLFHYALGTTAVRRPNSECVLLLMRMRHVLAGFCPFEQKGAVHQIWRRSAKRFSLQKNWAHFVGMPPERVPGDSREIWVQLLKTVNGLADGTREWTELFPRDSQRYRFLRRPSWKRVFWCGKVSQQGYHGIVLEWPTKALLVEETKSGSRQFLS